MAKNYVVHIPANSDTEEKFMKTVMPLLKDKVTCRLGALFGSPKYNDYVVTADDFERMKKFFATKILN